MADSIELLDTPKRASLQLQSAQIRAVLKEFERTFAAENNGRKPGKDDIKADTTVAAKYKDYNKIRDVLAGRLSVAVLNAPSSPKQRRHNRNDSGVSWTAQGNIDATPRKSLRPSQIEFYDAPASASPRPHFLTAIGPTPNRDGQALGLFDLLSNTGSGKSTSHTTPSGRKRKIDALQDVGSRRVVDDPITSTPRQRSNKIHGDILEHLTGTPASGAETGHRRHARTPVSASKKFMLSQFFATPSAVRYSSFVSDLDNTHDTPLRDRVLGLTPENKGELGLGSDATPIYLKRSVSFKERLLSASTRGKSSKPVSPPENRAGPPTLRHFRSATGGIPQVTSFDNTKHLQHGHQNCPEDDDFDDDLEALREIEGSEVNVLVSETQEAGNSEQPTRVYKKKGQKRTTRRAIMRPVNMKPSKQPRFVAAEENDIERSHKYNTAEEDMTRVEETQVAEQGSLRDGHAPHSDHEEDDDLQALIDSITDDEDTDFSHSDMDNSESDSHVKRRKKSTRDQPKHTMDDGASAGIKAGAKDKSKPPVEDRNEIIKEKKPKGVKKVGMINPNAQSHMNFKTLKIRNRNSKAGGAGRGRFGKGRR